MVSLQKFITQDADIDEDTGKEILSSVWRDIVSRQDIIGWEPYFSYFKRQCERALHDRGRQTLIRDFANIAVIRDYLVQQDTREELASKIESILPTKEPCERSVIDNTIDLVARVCSMVSIGTLGKVDCVTTKQTVVHWKERSLQEFLSAHFTQPQILDYSSVRLDRHFTAYNMEKIACFKIKWTDNLVDHLRIIDEKGQTVVGVFSDILFLQQQNWFVSSPPEIDLLVEANRTEPSLLPHGLAEETLRTIALLFPEPGKSTFRTLLRRMGIRRIHDAKQVGPVLPGYRRIQNYKYWRDRLVDLKENFDHAQPKTWRQWLHDRRDTPGWAAFWIAIIILLLTLVQCVEGALQTYRAFRPT